MVKLAREFKVKSLRLVVVFLLSLVIGLLTDRIFKLPPMFQGNLFKMLGIILILIGTALASISGRSLTVKGRNGNLPRGTTNKLVENGLYAYVRHPAFDGFFFILIGIVLIINSCGFLLMALVDIGLLIYFAIFIEERENYERFGERYLDYKKRVPAFIPRIRKNKD